jgi:hypothetical protein
MAPDDSPKAKYEDLQRRLQEEILTKYPNPERKGCPGNAALRALAKRPLTESINDDPVWQHVTHCSECYREFLAIQANEKHQRQSRREAWRWAVAIGAVVIALAVLYVKRGAFFEAKRPQNAELAYVPRRIDLDSMRRSANGGGESKPFYLGRDREELTIQLPVGSPAGDYEFQLRDSAKQVKFTRSATAQIDQGVTSFRVKADFTGLQPGRYEMDVRRVPFEWQYYPVVVR